MGTVSLELKKTDPRRAGSPSWSTPTTGSYEKKDRNVNEPLQFYSGKDPALYEIVVNTIGSKEPDLGLSVDAQERAGSAVP